MLDLGHDFLNCKDNQHQLEALPGCQSVSCNKQEFNPGMLLQQEIGKLYGHFHGTFAEDKFMS